MILGVSYFVSTFQNRQRLTDRVPFPIHDSPVPSLLFGLPDTIAQSLWAHVPIRQPWPEHVMSTYPLLAAPALIGLPMTILLSGIPA
jgi:hypothetical protein